MSRATTIASLCACMCGAIACASHAPEVAAPTPPLDARAQGDEELEAYARGGTFLRYGQKVVVTIAASGNRTISGFLPGARSPWVISKELTNGDAEEMEDRNGDGVWDSFRTLTHNPTGYHLLERVAHHGDNTPDEVIEEDVNVPKHERVRKVTHYFRAADGTWQSTGEPPLTIPYP